VLTGDGTARGDARLEDVPRELERAFPGARFSIVIKHERMEVAVAGMEDIGDAQAVRLGECADLLEHLAQPRPRYDAVLHVVARADPSHRRERGLACFPYQRPLGVAGSDPDLGRTARGARVDGLAQEGIGLDSGPVELDDERGATVRVPGVHGLLARSDGEPVHHLDRRGGDACGDDPRHRLAGIPHARERGKDRLRGLGHAHDPKHHLGDDAERPFAADHDAEEVVPGGVADRASEVRDTPVGGHEGRTEHVMGS